jgi:hypothetical protein
MTRRLGVLGTVARAALGLWFVGEVAVGHFTGQFRPLPWLAGLVLIPGLVLAWHRWRVARNPARLDATGPAGHLLHLALFCGMFSLPVLAPALWFAPDAALLFYGSALLFAATVGQSIDRRLRSE